MSFSTNVDLGNVLSTLTFIFALWQFHRANTKRFHAMEFKVGLMWKHFAHRFNLPTELVEKDKDD